MSVWIVGVGAIAGAAHGVDELRDAVDAGAGGERRVEDPARYLRMRGMRPLSHASRLACVAAAGALAHPQPAPGEPERRGAVLGTRWGSIEPLVEFERTARREGAHRVNPGRFPNVVVNVHAGYLAILFGLAGPNVTLCGPAAGLEAIGEAADMVALGRADAVLAGGTEDLGPSVAAGLGGVDAGEGAALLLLAREQRPDRPALARLAGFATRPAAGDVERARRDALDAAGAAAAERAWWSGEAPPNVNGAVLQTLAPVTGDCRAADGALAAAMAAADVARLGVPTLVTAFPADGTQAVALLRPR